MGDGNKQKHKGEEGWKEGWMNEWVNGKEGDRTIEKERIKE